MTALARQPGLPVPYSTEVERALIGRMLMIRDAVPDMLGRHVDREDFHTAECRLLFDRIVEAQADSGAVDSIIVGERARRPLAEIWGVPESEVSGSLRALAANASNNRVVTEHVAELKNLSARRRIIEAAEKALMAARTGDDPASVSMALSDTLTEIAVGGRRRSELYPRAEAVEAFMSELRTKVRIREAGGELGVVTGYNFFDSKVAGIQPGEVVMLAGEPGVGKSAIAQTVGRGFAHRQLRKEPAQRIGVLEINLEMTRYVDMSRDAQMITGIDGNRLRKAEIGEDDFRKLAQGYVKDRFRELPIITNYPSRLNASGMRAVVLDALNQGYNTGFIIIDHFRMFDLDRGMVSKDAGSNQIDEEKARFLKELAKDLNVAILCLAHTVKMDRMSDGRPTLADLRGSYQVAAYCDVVAFAYQPYMYASQTEIDNGIVKEDDAEMIFAKNRNGRKGSTEFRFSGETMHVEDRISLP